MTTKKFDKAATVNQNFAIVLKCETRKEMEELLMTATIKMLDEFIANSPIKIKKTAPKADKVEAISDFVRESQIVDKEVARINKLPLKYKIEALIKCDLWRVYDTVLGMCEEKELETIAKVLDIETSGEVFEKNIETYGTKQIALMVLIGLTYGKVRFDDVYEKHLEIFQELEVFGVWHESKNEFHGVIDFEIKKLPEIKTLDEALIKIKASATHSEIYSTIASCELSVQTELFRWCWPELEDFYTRPGLSKRPFEDKVSAVTSFMQGFDEVVWAYLTDKHETPKVFELLKNFINGEIKKIYSSFFNEPETQEKQLKFWQEQEEKLLNSENPDEHWEEITEIRHIMADLEDKDVSEQQEILEKCSEAFLWDMCRAYGVVPNDSKKIMAQRILVCHATAEQKIQILKRILPDIRIAFNCWTDNGRLSVNEAYKQSLKRLEAWLMFLSRKEKKL